MTNNRKSIRSPVEIRTNFDYLRVESVAMDAVRSDGFSRLSGINLNSGDEVVHVLNDDLIVLNAGGDDVDVISVVGKCHPAPAGVSRSLSAHTSIQLRNHAATAIPTRTVVIVILGVHTAHSLVKILRNGPVQVVKVASIGVINRVRVLK